MHIQSDALHVDPILEQSAVFEIAIPPYIGLSVKQ